MSRAWKFKKELFNRSSFISASMLERRLLVNLWTCCHFCCLVIDAKRRDLSKLGTSLKKGCHGLKVTIPRISLLAKRFVSVDSITHLNALDLRSVLLGSSSQYFRSSKILSMTGFNVSERYGMPTIWKNKMFYLLLSVMIIMVLENHAFF